MVYFEDCGYCGGTGLTWDYFKCEVCDGTGKLEFDDKYELCSRDLED